MEKLIHIKIDSISLEGMLKLPKNAKGIVLFSTGAGAAGFLPETIMWQMF